MTDIHRMYCTHCTFGTSVLEKRTTENAAKILGYSVRAASVADRDKIRRVFRSIERLLSYDLPKGTPSTEKVSYNAAKAPRRLVFMPRLNDHQVVGLMSYRSQDTAGRPGSYFGDFLVARTGATPSGDWSAVDCLRLWPAAHTGEIVDQWWCDSEERVTADEATGVFPIAPETLSSVSGPGIISDETFISFLVEPVGVFNDPGRVIPPRWSEIPAADRQILFARLAQATVDVLKSGKGNVTLVVEPSLAALLFYGVCRILPRRLLAADSRAAGLSFSTYDPSPDRATTTLVATVCHEQDADSDLPSEAYKRGFVCNTFAREFRYGLVSEPGNYVAHVVAFLQRESRIPDEVIEEYDALSDLSITEIDALPALTDDLCRYLLNAHHLSRYPQLTAKANGSLTSAGKGLRAVLVRKRLESLSPPYPPDLLAVVVDWLGNELVGDWKVKGPLYRALQPILPSKEEDLDDLILWSGGKLPQDIRDDAVIKVTLATGVLPKTVAVMAGNDKSTSKAGDALRRTIERVVPTERVEGILKATIEQHTDSFLPLIAKHFDTLVSVGGIQDRLPLAELLLKNSFPGGTLRPFEKWAILDSCYRSNLTRVPDDVWDDGIWSVDQLEECFRGVRTRDDLDQRKLVAKEWTKGHDAAKLPDTQLEALIDPWMKLIVAVDALRAGKETSKEQCRDSGEAIITAATSLIKDPTSTWPPPPESEIKRIIDRAVTLRCDSDAEKQRIAEAIESVQKEAQLRRRREIRGERWRNKRKKWIRSAKQMAARFAVPAVILILSIVLLITLVRNAPRFLPTFRPSEKQEQAKRETSRPAASEMVGNQSVDADAAPAHTTLPQGPSTTTPPASPPTGTPTATSSAPGTVLEQTIGTPSAPAIFPGAVPGGTALDPMEQIRAAVEKQSHRGQVIATVQKFVWGKEGAPLDVARIKLSLPKNDMFWFPDNIRVEGQGGFWKIEPNIAIVNMDGNGMTIDSTAGQPSPNALRASLLPLIISDSGSPQRWTWIDRSTEVDGSFSIPVSGKISADAAVNVHSIYRLRNKVVVEVSPKLNGDPVLSEPWRIRLGEGKEAEFRLYPVAGEWGYPVAVRVECVDNASLESLALRVSYGIGYFGVKDGSKNRVVKSNGDIESITWVKKCVELMKDSVLWGSAPREVELEEAYRELETKASEVVSDKAYCLAFLKEKISARVAKQVLRNQFNKDVQLDESKNHNCETRIQSLRAVLQTTDSFRKAASNHYQIESPFPLREDLSLKEKAAGDLEARIKYVVGKWESFFCSDEEFRNWCWREVRGEGTAEAKQTRLLALLWLSLEDSRDDFRRSKKNVLSGAEYLRNVSISCGAALRLEWFPADWDGEGDGVATVTPWFANRIIDMSALPVKAVPSAIVAPPTDAPAMEKDPLEPEVPQESMRGIPVP